MVVFSLLPTPGLLEVVEAGREVFREVRPGPGLDLALWSYQMGTCLPIIGDHVRTFLFSSGQQLKGDAAVMEVKIFNR